MTAPPTDHQVVPVRQLLHCQLGESMYLLTEPWPDGSVVLRDTTVVQQIRRVDSARPSPWITTPEA